MKKFLQASWMVGCVILCIVFLLSCFSAFIPPSAFNYMVFITIAFPYLFIALFIAAFISLWIHKKLAPTLFILLTAGLYNLFHTVAISPAGGWKDEKQAGSFRVMTWNVADFITALPIDKPEASVRKQILQAITKLNPDIMCLQEFNDVQRCKDLVSVKHEIDSLGYKYIYTSNDIIYRAAWGNVYKGVAICSKTPFLDTGKLLITQDWHSENMIYADVILQGKRTRISTAHLVSFYLFPDSAKGYEGERTVFRKLYYYRKDIQQKMRDIEVLHQQEAGKIDSMLRQSPYPVIYCGDMNTTPASYTYRKLKGNLQDAFLAKGNGIGATFYNIVPTLRIDMCFADDSISIVQTTVNKKKLTDHYPVITDMQW